MDSVKYCYPIQLLSVCGVVACVYHLIQAVFRTLLNHLLLTCMKLPCSEIISLVLDMQRSGGLCDEVELGLA
jgi:hypothetical protein